MKPKPNIIFLTHRRMGPVSFRGLRSVARIFSPLLVRKSGGFARFCCCCWHFHNLKLLFPSSFCWYFRYFLSETFIFRSQITFAYIKTINALSLYHLWYDAIYKRQYTSIPTKHLHWENVCNICERAKRASFKKFAFSHSNTAISLNHILLVLQILSFRNII